MGPYSLKKYVLAETGLPVKKKLSAFTAEVSPGTNPAYPEDRFIMYPEVLVACRHNKISAVQFLHTFNSNGDRYYYLGPLFSSGRAFVFMFVSWLEQCFADEEKMNVYLAAEFQNPDLFLFFKAMFDEYAFPQIDAAAIPCEVQRAARVFAEQVTHIRELDPQTLSCRCDDEICRKEARHSEVIRWMETRGVHIMEEHNQLLIVSVLFSERGEVLEKLRCFVLQHHAMKESMEKLSAQIIKTISEHDRTLFCTGKGR